MGRFNRWSECLCRITRGLLLTSVSLAGCVNQRHLDDIDTISLVELQRLRDAETTHPDALLLIDARSPDEFREGRIPAAINMSLSEVDPRKGVDKRIAAFETIVILRPEFTQHIIPGNHQADAGDAVQRRPFVSRRI